MLPDHEGSFQLWFYLLLGGEWGLSGLLEVYMWRKAIHSLWPFPRPSWETTRSLCVSSTSITHTSRSHFPPGSRISSVVGTGLERVRRPPGRVGQEPCHRRKSWRNLPITIRRKEDWEGTVLRHWNRSTHGRERDALSHWGARERKESPVVWLTGPLLDLPP